MSATQRALVTAALGALLAGCSSSVERRPGSENVMAVSGPDRTGHCEKLGEVRVSTNESYWIFDRFEGDVRRELTNLARNEAADENGDTVAPLSPMEDGEQTFGLYECIEGR